MFEYFSNCKIEIIFPVIGISCFFILFVGLVYRIFIEREEKISDGITVEGFNKIGKLRLSISVILLLCSMLLIVEPAIIRFLIKTDTCGNNIDEIPKSLVNKLDAILKKNTNILQIITEEKVSNRSSTDIDGEYFYRSSVKDEKQMLLDEEKKPAYMLIGYLTIKDNVITAHRNFTVRVSDDNVIRPRRARVYWDTNHMFVSPNNKTDKVIYKLTTKSYTPPANEGYFIGDVKDKEEKDGKSRAIKIIGEMHYLMRDDNSSRAIADKVLKRRNPGTNIDDNPYLTEEEIKKWFMDFYNESFQGKNFVFKSLAPQE